jgi:Kef-type K+ transport system membrane component KefB
VTWALLVFLAYVAVASALDVTPAFAAFLAGFGLIGGIEGTERLRFRGPMESLSAVAHSFFVPLYFAIVGLQLDFGKTFSLPILLGFLFGSSAVTIACGALAARLAGFRGIGVVNLAITTNARGGPGILLASVGYAEGIISQGFFTALVLTAVLTSQCCGAWLAFVLRRGWSLLGETPEQEAEWAAAAHEEVGLDETVEDPDLRLRAAGH